MIVYRHHPRRARACNHLFLILFPLSFRMKLPPHGYPSRFSRSLQIAFDRSRKIRIRLFEPSDRNRISHDAITHRKRPGERLRVIGDDTLLVKNRAFSVSVLSNIELLPLFIPSTEMFISFFRANKTSSGLMWITSHSTLAAIDPFNEGFPQDERRSKTAKKWTIMGLGEIGLRNPLLSNQINVCLLRGQMDFPELSKLDRMELCKDRKNIKESNSCFDNSWPSRFCFHSEPWPWIHQISKERHLSLSKGSQKTTLLLLVILWDPRFLWGQGQFGHYSSRWPAYHFQTLQFRRNDEPFLRTWSLWRDCQWWQAF
jgi:hypothetical protein